MSPKRYNSIVAGQTSIARKVFDAIPIETAWDSQQIARELSRNGSHLEYRIIEGCIKSLIEAGIVTEPEPRKYKREALAKKPEKKAPEMKPQAPATKAADAPANVDPIDILSALAARARKLSTDLANLAKDSEQAAIDISLKFEQNDEETKKLRQLKDLLKSM